MCPFKNLFGAPRTGVHSLRLFDVAVVDVLLTVIAGILLARYMKWNTLLTILLLIVISVPIHMMFCVETTLVKLFKN